MSGFPAVFQLSSLDGTNGFRLDGVAEFDNSGRAVASAGDVNGDGFDDLIIGADEADPDGSMFSGSTYVVFGKADGFSATLNLSSLDGTNGFRLDGVVMAQRSGFSVSSADDVNGDGFDDVIIGSPNASTNGGYSGASYVVFGSASGFAASMNLSLLDGTNGFRIDGAAAGDLSGRSVASAGDVNGDGLADLIISAHNASPNGYSSGASHVVFGRTDSFAATLDLSTLDGTDGFKLSGVAASDFSGFSVSSAGDVNGDGFDDVIVGANRADPNGQYSGASYVVFGKAGGFAANLNLSSLNGSNGFRIDGVAAYDQGAYSVSSAGDVNGDGFSDLIIGAPFADANAFDSGAAYVVFGKAGGFAADLDLSSLDGLTGFKLSGTADVDMSGFSVSSAGDVNGDGFDDVIIGASKADSTVVNSGISYVVFGKASGFAVNLNLSSLDGYNGFRIDGAAIDDQSGFSVSAAGDVNGDGVDDLIVGARDADPNAINSGSSYVIFGQRALTSVSIIGTAHGLVHNAGLGDDFIDGKDGEDTLRGWEGDDTLLGGAGNDLIDGGTGNDIVSGGSGNDTVLGSLGEDDTNGGSGIDTLDFAAFFAGSSVSVNLATGQVALSTGEFQSVFSIENVTGGRGADTLTGDIKANVLRGGIDNDELDGGSGNDVLSGGNGKDILTGGLGNDRFSYTAVAQSRPGTTRDDITDFTVAAGSGSTFIDRIDLAAIDAMAGQPGDNSFTFIGAAGFTSEGQIRAVQDGANTNILINTTGTSGTDMAIVLQNFTATDLTAADFIL